MGVEVGEFVGRVERVGEEEVRGLEVEEGAILLGFEGEEVSN